jgi:hypothetical protein
MHFARFEAERNFVQGAHGAKRFTDPGELKERGHLGFRAV